MIHLYSGNGKGKTTASIGMIVRLLNYNKKILLVSFLKDGRSGEFLWLRNNSNVKQLYQEDLKKFIKDMNELEFKETKKQQNELIDKTKLLAQDFDVIVLDEFIDIISLNIINEEKAIELLKSLAKDHEVIVTGHQATERLISLADYYTEFIQHKHPFYQGVKAREGVEY